MSARSAGRLSLGRGQGEAAREHRGEDDLERRIAVERRAGRSGRGGAPPRRGGRRRRRRDRAARRAGPPACPRGPPRRRGPRARDRGSGRRTRGRAAPAPDDCAEAGAREEAPRELVRFLTSKLSSQVTVATPRGARSTTRHLPQTRRASSETTSTSCGARRTLLDPRVTKTTASRPPRMAGTSGQHQSQSAQTSEPSLRCVQKIRVSLMVRSKTPVMTSFDGVRQGCGDGHAPPSAAAKAPTARPSRNRHAMRRGHPEAGNGHRPTRMDGPLGHAGGHVPGPGPTPCHRSPALTRPSDAPRHPLRLVSGTRGSTAKLAPSCRGARGARPTPGAAASPRARAPSAARRAPARPAHRRRRNRRGSPSRPSRPSRQSRQSRQSRRRRPRTGTAAR